VKVRKGSYVFEADASDLLTRKLDLKPTEERLTALEEIVGRMLNKLGEDDAYEAIQPGYEYDLCPAFTPTTEDAEIAVSQAARDAERAHKKEVARRWPGL
jgi:hypothetical protein